MLWPKEKQINKNGNNNKKKETLPYLTTWMNLKDMLSKISQSQKDKYCMIPLI